MDRITGWITAWKIPVGEVAADAMDWLTANATGLFDALDTVLDALVEAILWVLTAPPALVVILVIVALTYMARRSVGLAITVGLGLLFVVNQGYWQETMETLSLVIAAAVVCMGLGVPIGIWLAHRPRAYAFVRPVLDLMQTLPTFVYLIPAIVLFGLGMVPGLVATVIFVLPAPIRLTQLGISSVPKPMIEAGQAFGASRMQMLTKVELPAALPQIMAGLTQTIMLSLSMVVIAALVGADGLGVPVVRALNTVNTRLGFEAGVVIVVVAILMDRMFRLRDRT